MNGRAREILLTIFGGGLRIVYEPVSREVREYFGKAVAAQSGAGLHTSAGVCHISYDEGSDAVWSQLCGDLSSGFPKISPLFICTSG